MTGSWLIAGVIVFYCVVTYAIASSPTAARPRRRVRRGYESPREIAEAPKESGCELERDDSALSAALTVVTTILDVLDDDAD